MKVKWEEDKTLNPSPPPLTHSPTTTPSAKKIKP